MFSTVLSAALVGVRPTPVRVESHIGGGKPTFCLVGLPDTAIREARDRVRAALSSTGFDFPARRVTVNLAPAEFAEVWAPPDNRRGGVVLGVPKPRGSRLVTTSRR